MSFIQRSLLLSLATGALVVAADAAAPATPAGGAAADAAAPAKPAPQVFTGAIQTKKHNVLKVVMDAKDQKLPKDKEPQAFEVGDKTKITIDGKDGNLKHLVPEMEVKVTYDATGVISIEATTPKKNTTK